MYRQVVVFASFILKAAFVDGYRVVKEIVTGFGGRNSVKKGEGTIFLCSVSKCGNFR